MSSSKIAFNCKIILWLISVTLEAAFSRLASVQVLMDWILWMLKPTALLCIKALSSCEVRKRNGQNREMPSETSDLENDKVLLLQSTPLCRGRLEKGVEIIGGKIN
ncbi:hypothetical protein SLE2022_188530 [Rubroshorea leprosula]